MVLVVLCQDLAVTAVAAVSVPKDILFYLVVAVRLKIQITTVMCMSEFSMMKAITRTATVLLIGYQGNTIQLIIRMSYSVIME